MKRMISIITVLAMVLAFVFMWGCSEKQLENTLDDYEEIIEEGIPDDLKLTIYYIEPTTLTLVPVRTVEDFMGYSPIVIEVTAAELAAHRDLLASLNAACLKPVAEDADTHPIIGFIRLVYVLERGDGEVLLEVIASDIIYHGGVLVNGFEVENDPIFYDLINPFLTEEDRNTLKYLP